MQVYNQSGRWIIGKNAHMIENADLSGSLSSSSDHRRETCDCWTGDHWVSEFKLALEFSSRAEAQAYLDANRERMKSSA